MERSTFLEVSFLLIHGELPDQVRVPAVRRTPPPPFSL